MGGSGERAGAGGVEHLGEGSVLGGRYRIVRRLGAGGFGTVYEAERARVPGPRVAVKVIDPLLARDEGARARFLREVEAASRLSHPNVLATRDGDVTPEGVLYCAMDLSPGRSLRAVLGAAPGGRLDPRRALAIVRQVLDALGHAHERGVVHRDVKPDNVMIERDEASGAEVAKVVDFGLAKLLDAGGSGAMSPPGAIVGTTQYLAPEQARGEAVDGRADLYAAGVLLWELLTGALPFVATSAIGYAVAHATEPAPRLSQRHAGLGLPRAIEEALARALEKSPAARFESAAEFRAALERAAESLPPEGTLPRPASGRIPSVSGPLLAPGAAAQLGASKGVPPSALPPSGVPMPSPVRTITTPQAPPPATARPGLPVPSESTYTTGTPAAGEPPPGPVTLANGFMLGRYAIEGTIGSGGMGAVYRARHVLMKRPAAIKVIQAELAKDDVIRQRFLREARVASLFRHPCVVELYDFEEAGPLCYLAMELVEGRPLDRVLKEEGALPLARVARIFDQLLDALAAAHEAGVVHRDLKPANLMLGAGDRIKILDFGIARFLERAQAETTSSAGPGLTALGDFIGTPAYAAPEQIQGFAVDARADLYTAGVMLFEVAAGRRPFLSATAEGYLEQHLGSEPPPLWQARPDLPHVQALDAIIQKALAKDAEARWRSALEMREALLAVLGPLIPVEHAPTRRYERPASASGVNTAVPPTHASVTRSGAFAAAPPTRDPFASSQPPAASSGRPAVGVASTAREVHGRPCALLLCEGAPGLAKLFAIGGTRLALGRSREDPKRGIRNDAIVRAIPCRDQQRDPENWSATVQVSHAHAEVAVDGARATALDRSSRGTVLDGAALPKEKATALRDAFALDVATPLLRLEGRIVRGPAESSSLEGATDLGDAAAEGPVEAIVLRRAVNARDHAYALVPRSLTIGRAPHAAVDVAAAGVAPLHARLTFVQGALCVEALEGPVTIDGARLEPGAPVPLLPGARVAMGAATLTFKEADDADFTS